MPAHGSPGHGRAGPSDGRHPASASRGMGSYPRLQVEQGGLDLPVIKPDHPEVVSRSDPFPANRGVMVLPGVVGNRGVGRDVFRPDELAWVDSTVAAIMDDPPRWVDAWMALVSARSAALQVKFVSTAQKDPLGRLEVSRGYPYKVEFLAWFAVRHTVAQLSLGPNNRSLLAEQLKAQPHEAELLTADPFAGSAIRSILAEAMPLEPDAGTARGAAAPAVEPPFPRQ